MRCFRGVRLQQLLSGVLAVSMLSGLTMVRAAEPVKEMSFSAPSEEESLVLVDESMTAGTKRDIVLEYTLPVTMEQRMSLFGTFTLTLPEGITADEHDQINVAGRGDVSLSQQALENSADGAYDYSGEDYGYAQIDISADGRTITYANADFRPNNGVDVVITLKDKEVPAQSVPFEVSFESGDLFYTDTCELQVKDVITDFARDVDENTYSDFTSASFTYTAQEGMEPVFWLRRDGGAWEEAENAVVDNGTATISGLVPEVHYECKLVTDAGDSNILPFYSGTFNVLDYGAAGDGVTDDSDAIDAAIRAANAQGGGLVVFPAGHTYASNTIHLLSNVHLYLDEGVVLKALGELDEVEPINEPFSNGQDFGHSHFHAALFWAERQENIAVECNNATITGNQNLVTGDIEQPGMGDKTFSFKLCKDITVKGTSKEAPLTFLDYGHFAFIATGCDNVTVENIYVGDLENQRDVVNFMQCNNTTAKNVKVLKCSNDIIKLGSDYSLGFVRNVSGTYVENIYADYIGGGNVFQLGSETFGDFSDLTIKNVTITQNADKAGLGFCVNDGGSVRNVTIENVNLANCSGGITLMASDRQGRVPDAMVKAGTIDNVTIKNATLKHNQGNSGAIPVIISGFQAHRTINDMVEGTIYPLTNITFENVSIEASGDYAQTLEHADSEIVNVGAGGCYRPSSYPNAQTLPAYALLITKVDGMTIDGGSLTYEDTQNNNRYALVLDNAQNISVSNMNMMLGQAVGNVIDVRGESSYTFNQIRMIPFTADGMPEQIFSVEAVATQTRTGYPNHSEQNDVELARTKLAPDTTKLDDNQRTISVLEGTTGQKLADQLTSLKGRFVYKIQDQQGQDKEVNDVLKIGDQMVVTAPDGTEKVYSIVENEENGGEDSGGSDTGDTDTTTPPVVIVRPAFNDIANQWYTDAANYVGRNGIMSGVGGGRFDPDGFSSRAMVAQVIYNMEGSPATTGVSGFTDVLAGQWYTDAVTWNVSAKIVSGYGNGLFGTNDNVTREQLVVLLYRYAQYKGYGTSASGSLAAFVDSASVSDWATQAMSWAVANGIINGKDGARLDPQGTATRAEMAKILMTFCQDIAQ